MHEDKCPSLAGSGSLMSTSFQPNLTRPTYIELNWFVDVSAKQACITCPGFYDTCERQTDKASVRKKSLPTFSLWIRRVS